MALDFIWKLFEKLRRPLGFFLLFVLTSILQRVLDLSFVCPCGPGLYVNDVLFMTLTSLILTFVVNIVNIFYKKKFFSTVEYCTCKRCYCCSYFGKRAIKFLSPAALWAAMVLFDGDWYFCLRTHLNSNQTELPCKDVLTDDDKQTIHSYKMESLNIGLGVCCGLLLLWIFVESFRTRSRSCCHRCRRNYYEAMYTKNLSDELSSFIEEELKTFAKTKAKQMCERRIEVIRNYELSQNNGIENEVSQIWENISDPNFIFESQRVQPLTPSAGIPMRDLPARL